MPYFVDFETDGLDGKVIDCAYVAEGGMYAQLISVIGRFQNQQVYLADRPAVPYIHYSSPFIIAT